MQKFNLLYEPWIQVFDSEDAVKEVSIRDVLLHGGDYVSLAGENRLQDVAILRLLAAIAVTMLYRYNLRGQLDDLRKKSDKDVAAICREIWEHGLSEEIVDAFCHDWEHRFYLFDDKYPFMQVDKDRFRVTKKKCSKKSNPVGYVFETDSEKGVAAINYFPAKAWVGIILESNNSKSPFVQISDVDNLRLSYAEAARWLVWFLSFSPCSAKNPKCYNSKMTWASQGALLMPKGRNVRETLCLNSVLMYKACFYEEIKPIWERETTPVCTYFPYGEEGHPNNLPEFYTSQSRKVRLYEEDGSVLGMFLTSGDSYGSKNAFAEAMFLWQLEKNKKTGLSWVVPKHQSDVTPVWKNISVIFPFDEDKFAPGVVTWISFLYEQDVISSEYVNIPYQVTDIFYGNMQAVVDKIIETEIVVNKKYFDPAILENFEAAVRFVSKVGDAVARFTKYFFLSQGADSDRISAKVARVKRQYESEIGVKVCDCLEDFISVDELKELALDCGNAMVNEMIEKAPLSAYIGHGKYSLAQAEKSFMMQMCKYKKELEGN